MSTNSTPQKAASLEPLLYTVELPRLHHDYERLRFTVIDSLTIAAWFEATYPELPYHHPVKRGPVIVIEGRHRIHDGPHHLEAFSSALARHLTGAS